MTILNNNNEAMWTDMWRRVKNHCRTTVRKDFTEKDPTDAFKWMILISEHSPIRLLEFDWSWRGIKYWVSTHWVRHKFEKFVSTQRNDRQKEYDRNDAPQDTLVNFDGYANMQQLIDAWRKRLCFQASPETRELAEDFKRTLYENDHKIESDVLVPNCIYRGGCPEMKTCGYWNSFLDWALKNGYTYEDMLDINKRYAAYNRRFYRN